MNVAAERIPVQERWQNNRAVGVRIEGSTLFLDTNAEPRQCYSLELLGELAHTFDFVETDTMYGLTHAVYLSDDEHAFNYGGDLNYFVQAIEAQDRAQLYNYGLACIDLVYRWFNGIGGNVVTVSVVEGDALGGGFESALSANVLVAERGTQFGFPEIMFNLFPGMGGYHLIAYKLNAAMAEKMILGGDRFSAEELFELGLVDVLAEKGAGRQAALSYIKKSQKRLNGELGLRRAVHTNNPVSWDVLEQAVSQWADAAMTIPTRNRRLMKRLVSKQTAKK